MITRAASNKLDVSDETFLDRLMDGLEEGDTPLTQDNATNKDNHHPEELMADDKFDLGLGADQDLIESQQQKEHHQQEQDQEHQHKQEHKEEEQDQDQQIVNINQDIQ